MRKIVEYGIPSKISGRTYHRGSIKLPDISLPIDIVITNNSSEHRKIGEAYLIENEKGIFIKSYKFDINIHYLNEIMDIYYQKNKSTVDKYDSDITIVLYTDKYFKEYNSIYNGKNDFELRYLTKHILTDESIDTIIRDIKLATLII